MTMKILLCCSALALGSCLWAAVPASSALPASSAQPLTLAEAVDAVLARYPSLDAAQAAVDAARGRSLESGAARLPQVSVNGAYTYMSLRPYVDFSLPGGTSALYETVANSYNVTLGVSQLLTDFGRTDALVALARTGEISARDALEQARHQLGYQTIQAFYSALLWRESVSVADEEIMALDEALRITENKLGSGKATKFDVLTTQVRLANSRNARADRVAALERQEALLRQLLGYDPGAPVLLAGEFAPTAGLPDLSATIVEGLQNRPEMKLARDAQKAAGLKLDAANRENRPVVTAQAVAGLENGMLPAMYDNKGYVTAGLGVSIPIFTGRRIAGERIEARGELRSAQGRASELARTITTDVEDSLADLKNAQTHLVSSDTMVAQAQEALSLAKLRYTNGVITNFELLDAQSNARAAELVRLQARYDCVMAGHAVARAAGRRPLQQ
jgi:outer membrane protein TolC